MYSPIIIWTRALVPPIWTFPSNNDAGSNIVFCEYDARACNSARSIEDKNVSKDQYNTPIHLLSISYL